jgi:O-antigen/teichoic acid export membrane protein
MRALLPLIAHTPKLSHPARLREAVEKLLKTLIGRLGAGYLVSSVLLISGQSDVLIIGMIAGAEGAARYTLVRKLADFAVQSLSRIPEMATPMLIRLDAAGDRQAMRRQYLDLLKLTFAVAIPAGVGYALFGSWILQVWLGAKYVPEGYFGFLLAGSAIVCVATARPVVVLAEARASFRSANLVSFVAVSVRIILTLLLYGQFGYLSPLVALNIVYICGGLVAYHWVGRRMIAESEVQK